jgi:hypothetical protein
MAFLHHCTLESGGTLPHHRSHDDPGQRSQDDIGGKDKWQEQRHIRPLREATFLEAHEHSKR